MVHRVRESVGGLMTGVDSQRGVLLVSRADAARACGVSMRTWDRLVHSGKTPPAIRLGGRPRWRADELREWAAAGCPSRREWEAMTAGGKS